jgi:hypothetical protein
LLREVAGNLISLWQARGRKLRTGIEMAVTEGHGAAFDYSGKACSPRIVR